MIVVFAGPTISTSEVLDVLPDARVLPPAAVGDLYAATRSRATTLGIIDGYFDGSPSVWHKEILHALDAGIPVFGASSMGALRAAECHAFGMIGIGRIFEHFRDGILEDDDEVAVIHGPSELGYVLLSEPMVNIRETLATAVREGILTFDTAERLTDLAKSTPYPERNWKGLLDRSADLCLDGGILDRFDAWRSTGYVDQKRLDAVDMLEAIRRYPVESGAFSPPAFTFRHTAMWRDLVHQTEETSIPLNKILVLDVLRHDPDRFREIKRRIALKAAESGQDGETGQPAGKAIDRALNQFRMRNQLFTAAALNDWLAANRLDIDQLRDQLASEIAADNIVAQSSGVLAQRVFDALSANPDDADVLREAARQGVLLRQYGYDVGAGWQIRLEPVELLIWYFETLLRRSIPHDLDNYLAEYSFGDRDEFEQMMARQFIVWHNNEEQC